MLAPLPTLEKLGKALDQRAREVREAEAWYGGDHELPQPPPNTAAATDSEARLAFQAMAKLSITNLLPPIVDVPAGALRNEGFRFGESSTASDADAWAIWQRNHLDADEPLAIHKATQVGNAFHLVWAGADGLAEITVEDPSQCIVMYEPGSRRRRAAGLKRWVDDDGYTYATLYLPEFVYKFVSASPAANITLPNAGNWVPRQPADEAWPLKNPLGAVPLVEMRANAPLAASLYGGGAPQFAKQLNEQRKLNRTVMGLLITEENQAFRQRWATDWAYPTKPDGTPDREAMVKFSASRLATFQSGDGETPVKVGEFTQADFTPILAVLLNWVKIMSATSGTPHYHFSLGDMVNVAADVLARIDGTQLGVRETLAAGFGESIEEVMSLALAVEGNPKAADTATSVVWADFERRTLADQIAYAKTLHELGAPLAAVFAALPGITQEVAAKWAREADGAAVLRSVLTGANTVTTTTPPAAPVPA